ncbi:DUF2470 domain-containing protein [Streptomyces sp. NBC_00083]|uniref:DUF2470 domain-containing protein n=1 Tax=Streptomyces sp. NBC_00083 TaxID=2975647 RepID=UPI00224E6375|nr:DUF2470 domain-containing protein [Streptomyces sp. NBC_00083]MCX5386476.1 DUF2470 domain-containing protein [Streptomyces sp. NBC_00083]
MRPHRARTPQPTPAERVRSVIAAAHSMTVVTDGRDQEVYSLDGAGALGRIHLHDPADPTEALPAGPRIPVRLELTDIAPTPVRDRLRARVTLSGLVAKAYSAHSPDSTCMEFGQAVIEDAAGRTYVSLEELQEAPCDPMAPCEAGMLTHLVDDHPDLVPLLLRLVEPRLKHGVVRALPLAMDRYGVTLRLELPASHRDVRLPFPTALNDIDQAGLQFHALLTAARRSSHQRLPA